MTLLTDCFIGVFIRYDEVDELIMIAVSSCSLSDVSAVDGGESELKEFSRGTYGIIEKARPALFTQEDMDMNMKVGTPFYWRIQKLAKGPLHRWSEREHATFQVNKRCTVSPKRNMINNWQRRRGTTLKRLLKTQKQK